MMQDKMFLALLELVLQERVIIINPEEVKFKLSEKGKKEVEKAIEMAGINPKDMSLEEFVDKVTPYIN